MRKSRVRELKWFYQDLSTSKSQSQPSNRSNTLFSLTHSGERPAPTLNPTGLCKSLYHHNAFQLCMYVMGVFRMSSYDIRIKEAQAAISIQKRSLCSLTYLTKIEEGGPIQNLVTLLHPLPLLPSSLTPEPLSHYQPPGSLLSQGQEAFSFHFSSPLTEFLTIRPTQPLL